MSEHKATDGLRLEYKPPLCVITIDNPQERNRLTLTAVEALAQIAAALRSRDDIHVVLIESIGNEYFCTGLLNPVLRGRMSKEQVIDLVRKATDAFEAIEELPQLVVAAINGNL